ncbi:MAG: hypothetical protein E7620_07200, partial [Ruminococcaceae bacterium]|nr:hypothetical protein [Oscillospiraceae bacterium]
MKEMKPKWHCMTAEEAAVRLHSNASCGLSRKEACSRFKKNGANTLFRAVPRLLPLFRQFLTDPGQLIFLTVALLAFLFGEVWSAGLALGTFLVWFGYGVLHLWRMQKRCDALLWYRIPTPLVLREGKKQRISADRLVVGDLVLLKEGDIVPADL